jgi:hypothetical protein
LQRTQKAIDDINLQLYYQSPDVFSPKIEEVFTRMDEDSAKIKTECKSASIQTALSAYQGNYNDLVGIINRLVGA